MGKFFVLLVLTFIPIIIINIGWGISTFVTLVFNGIQGLLNHGTFLEGVITSRFLKWILLIDAIWLIMFFIYSISRKRFRTETDKHFLQKNYISDPKICVIIPAYNEEATIQQVVISYRDHRFVKEVIVIDNHSEDKTVEMAKLAGARVITKDVNRGFAHSVVMGFSESLKTDVNIIALTEADGTLDANDLDKMLPYLDHCDVVHGSRQLQILTEKGNLRESAVHVWGQYFFAKLIQFKYLNWTHLGIVDINDIGCMLRIFRRETIEQIQGQLNYPRTDIPIGGISFPIFLVMKCLEKDFRIIEVPVTYRRRVGSSKIGSEKIHKNLIGGLHNLWIVLKY